MDQQPSAPSAERTIFPCPKCGGELEWDPSHQEMHCPYCDSLVPVPAQPGFRAEEHDLMAFLEEHPRAEGYGVTLEQLSCKQCGATVQVPPGRRDLTCPFCGSSYVLEAQAPLPNVIQPESLIPFRVDQKASQSRFKEWLGRGWFRPNDLKRLGSLQRIVGLYLPFFTFDADASSSWTADAGYYYNVSEQVSVTNDRGEARWETRQVQKVRWEPASGSRSDRYDDVLVPAVLDDRLRLILRVYPYDMKGLMAYSPAYLAGFGILNADIALKMVYQIAKSNMEGDQVQRCSHDVPGDTQRDLRVSTTLSAQTFKHLLCPIWAGSFRYKGKAYPFVLNGQTGALYGEKPWSWVKIALASGAAAILLLLFFLLTRGH